MQHFFSSLKHTQMSREEGGFTLLLAILVISIILSIGLAIVNVTVREYLISGMGRESEIAFYAADGGMECATYWDTRADGGSFAFGAEDASVTCMGTNLAVDTTSSGGTLRTSLFEIDWGPEDEGLCARVAVRKYYDPSDSIVMQSGATCAQGRICTELESRGYNTSCNTIETAGRVAERALRARR